jgi:hypothetical protein
MIRNQSLRPHLHAILADAPLRVNAIMTVTIAVMGTVVMIPGVLVPLPLVDNLTWTAALNLLIPVTAAVRVTMVVIATAAQAATVSTTTAAVVMRPVLVESSPCLLPPHHRKRATVSFRPIASNDSSNDSSLSNPVVTTG